VIRYLLIADSLSNEGKLAPRLIPALLELEKLGYRPVASDEERGTVEFLESQGVKIELVSGLDCLSAFLPVVLRPEFDRQGSFLVGNTELAQRLEVSPLSGDWNEIARALKSRPRIGRASRVTRETRIEAIVNLDGEGRSEISTGLGFFDHMLEQLAKHGGYDLALRVEGDLHIDEHHTIEDTGLCLGEALRQAISDKVGIGRYGFVVPMDEAEARVSLDLSGRAYLVFDGAFKRERVGELPTELVPHFFRSLSDTLGATLHIETRGENAHHMIESCFKAVGRCLRQAFALTQTGLPSTKGVL